MTAATKTARVRQTLEAVAARCIKCGKKLGKLMTEFVKDHLGAVALDVPCRADQK